MGAYIVHKAYAFWMVILISLMLGYLLFMLNVIITVFGPLNFIVFLFLIFTAFFGFILFVVLFRSSWRSCPGASKSSWGFSGVKGWF